MKIKNILLSLLLLLSLKNGAQNLSLNIPFVEESMQPEMFFLAPHYDSNNQLTYYSFGDFLKVAYTFDKQNRPQKKIFYTWDKYDYKWETQNETFFTYYGNRLIEERTEQLYPKVEGQSVTKTKLSIISKQYSFNPQLNTEKIIHSIDMPEISFVYSGYSTSTISTKYLNKYNLPDSMIVEGVRNGETWWISKVIYSYDNKQRNTRTEAFYKYEDFWTPTYSFNVKYEKNKIIYTQFFAPRKKWKEYDEVALLDSAEDSELENMVSDDSEEEDEDEFEYEYPDTVLFTISFDNKNRITSQYLQSRKSVILDTRYSYDTQGRTLINHEQNFDEYLLRSIVMPGVNVMKGLECLRYSTIYDKDNCSYSIYHKKNEEGNMIKMAEINNCYSPEETLLSHKFIRYEDDGDVDDFKQIDFKYNADGLSGESIEYRDYRDIDENEKKIEPDEKIIFRNNAAGQRIYEEKFRYSDENTWKPSDKYIYDYDENGFEKYAENLSYSTYDKKWEGKYCCSYKRDDKNRILSEENKHWYDGKWENSTQENFSYDTNNNKILIDKYKWDSQNICWKGVYHDTFVYNDNGDKTEEVEYGWDENQKQWNPKWKTEYYQTPKRELNSEEKKTIYKWEENQWIPNQQSFNKKTRDSGYTEISSYSKWNRERKDWDMHSLDNRYWSENVESEEEYEWNTSLNILEGRRHILTQKSSARDSIQRTYYLWNYNTKAWRNAIRTSTLNNENNNRVITFESYNTSSDKWIPERKVDSYSVNDTIDCMEQFIWNKGTTNWMKDRKNEFYYYNSDNSSNRKSYKLISYTYDKQSDKWTPQYHYEDAKFDGNKGTTYLKWNNSTQKWEEYCRIISQTFIGTNFYTWDKATGKWKEPSDWAIEGKINKELDSISIENEVDYYTLVRENEQPKKDYE